MSSEAMIYRVTQVACDDQHEGRLKAMASCPNLEDLFYCLTLHPQLCKAFVRTSDLLGAISCYYQGVNFRPGMAITATRQPEKVELGIKDYVNRDWPNNSTDPSLTTAPQPAVRRRAVN